MQMFRTIKEFVNIDHCDLNEAISVGIVVQ